MLSALLLAAADAPAADPAALNTGLLVVGLGTLLNLALTAKQLLTGNKGERQIEPTQLAAITSELQHLTGAVNALNREVGTHALLAPQIDALHVRVGAISRELSATVARVDGIEKREDRRHA